MLSLLKDLLLLQERKGVLFAGSKLFDLFGFVFPISEFPVNGAGCFPHLPLIHFKSLFSLSVCCTPNFGIGLVSVWLFLRSEFAELLLLVPVSAPSIRRGRKPC